MGEEDPDAVVEEILRRYRTITVVGASNNASKAAHSVPAHMQRHGWRIVPVNPRGGTILGEQAYSTLADVPEPVEFVNVFRPSEQTAEIARQAAAVGASALWLQLGIMSDEARRVARDGGMSYVEDRCLLIEQARLGLGAPVR
jgi:predicted CoA-binding protein